MERNARWTAGSAIVLVALAFAFSVEMGRSALTGGCVACLSAFLASWLVRALLRAGDRARPLIGLVVVAKSGIVLGLCAAALSMFHPNGLGFALGISALVVGAMGAALHGFFTSSDAPPASPDGPSESSGPALVSGAASGSSE